MRFARSAAGLCVISACTRSTIRRSIRPPVINVCIVSALVSFTLHPFAVRNRGTESGIGVRSLRIFLSLSFSHIYIYIYIPHICICTVRRTDGMVQFTKIKNNKPQRPVSPSLPRPQYLIIQSHSKKPQKTGREIKTVKLNLKISVDLDTFAVTIFIHRRETNLIVST